MSIRSESSPVYAVAKQASKLLTLAEEDQIVLKAIAICESRLTSFGQAFASPNTVKDFFVLRLSGLEAEQLDILFLNNQHQLISCETMFKGTIDGAAIYPREIAKRALTLNAAAIVLAHNHPSGVNNPSTADINITTKIKNAMEFLDIRVLDHIIVGGVTAYSFSESGLI